MLGLRQRLSITISNFGWGLVLWLPLLWHWLLGRLRGIRVLRGLYYADAGHPQQRLDIYTPSAGGTSLPIVIYMHGGGFVLGSRFTHAPVAYAYARRGYLVFNLDYRTAPVNRFPAAIEDCCAAYVWIVQNAARFGGDTTRIAVAGESAGGNLAANLVIAACYERPEPWTRKVYETGVVPSAAQLICSYGQVTELDRYKAFKGPRTWEARNGRHIAAAFARAYLGKDGLSACEANMLADPVRFFERGVAPSRPLPLIFASVGEWDLVHNDTQRLVAALDRVGARVSTHYYPGEQHVFHMLPWRRKAATTYWNDCFSFLEHR